MKHVLGVDSAVAPAVILARHDRKNTLLMKHYFRSIANIMSKQMKEVNFIDGGGISTISDFDWILPTTVKQCHDTLTNFAAVNRSLWPMDHTDIALTKVFSPYAWCGAASNEGDRVKLIRALFNRVSEDNAFRAADSEPPLSYEEIERTLKDILIGKSDVMFHIYLD